MKRDIDRLRGWRLVEATGESPDAMRSNRRRRAGWSNRCASFASTLLHTIGARSILPSRLGAGRRRPPQRRLEHYTTPTLRLSTIAPRFRLAAFLALASAL